jgi:predicted short-subunit dehydrogenase-like oxidoreductase (DUF2520 family)
MLGAGNVSTHLSRHLRSRGHTIPWVYSRHMERAVSLASETGSRATDHLEELPMKADFFMACLPDREVAGVSARLSDREGIWIHTAGALPLEVLQAHHPRCGVLYPLQSFSRDREVPMAEVPLLIEGSDPEVTETLFSLATGLSEVIREISSSSRLVVHLAAVFANNFTNHMLHIAQQIMETEGKDVELLVPLIRETFRKAEELGAASAQTGPAARGDGETMQKHLDLLRAYPEWKNLYTFISRDIARSRN